MGRNPAAITRSVHMRFDPTNLDATRESAKSFIQVGAAHIIFILQPPYPEEMTRRLAGEVIEPLR